MLVAYTGGAEHWLGNQSTYFPANMARDARLRKKGICRIVARLRLPFGSYTGCRFRKLDRTS
ncbi:hypothetical protein N7508_007153 [Penicillium antarcticum]|uniref:uncharacterized protein n=1 Tax=Penicillium antarcticum TaxID=416450 RepID=UPI002391F5A3|nr:uncharacterized protein N7508_007153 [Penicillium antarcticum]KAJ5302290.1 hypothetical protein N7508_007153 [Penicillium antarcticum]